MYGVNAAVCVKVSFNVVARPFLFDVHGVKAVVCVKLLILSQGKLKMILGLRTALKSITDLLTLSNFLSMVDYK